MWNNQQTFNHSFTGFLSKGSLCKQINPDQHSGITSENQTLISTQHNKQDKTGGLSSTFRETIQLRREERWVRIEGGGGMIEHRWDTWGWLGWGQSEAGRVGQVLLKNVSTCMCSFLSFLIDLVLDFSHINSAPLQNPACCIYFIIKIQTCSPFSHYLLC